MATEDSDGTYSSHAEKAHERARDVNAQRASLDRPGDVICECARPDCSELIAINALEYDALRSHATWFVIAPFDGHFFPEAERIVATNGHYWVVEKHDGARKAAAQFDP